MTDNQRSREDRERLTARIQVMIALAAILIILAILFRVFFTDVPDETQESRVAHGRYTHTLSYL